jgi:hypothetical protein
MTTLKDLEKQIKKQRKIHAKAKEVAKASYNNKQDDMLSRLMEEHIAEDILTALEKTLERVREKEEIRLRGY